MDVWGLCKQCVLSLSNCMERWVILVLLGSWKLLVYGGQGGSDDRIRMYDHVC